MAKLHGEASELFRSAEHRPSVPNRPVFGTVFASRQLIVASPVQKHNNLTEEQQRLFNTAVFARIVSEDPAEPRELSTLYIASSDDYGGPDRAFKRGAPERQRPFTSPLKLPVM